MEHITSKRIREMVARLGRGFDEDAKAAAAKAAQAQVDVELPAISKRRRRIYRDGMRSIYGIGKD